MMKNRKRNLTVLAVLSFVCAAVALNWTYNSRWGKPDAEMVYAEDEAMAAAQMDFARSLTTAGTEYFAEARLTRQVSRDEALELLQTAASSEAAARASITREDRYCLNSFSSSQIAIFTALHYPFCAFF